jgi:ribose 5-phosphate isomerase B
LKIGLAADHAGQTLKASIESICARKGMTFARMGRHRIRKMTTPIIARVLGEALQRGEVERAIFCCGSGIGPAVALNKMPGIRATVVDNEWSARDAVTHVDVNAITLGERVIGDELAKSCIDAFLAAAPEGGRHERRRKQIEALEPRPMTTADAGSGMRRGV